MDKSNDSKKRLGLTVGLAMFFLFRTLIFMPAQHLGISVTDADLTVTVRTVMLFALLVLFSFFASAVTVKIQTAGGELVSFLLILLIADPVFFTMQNDCLRLMISCIGLLFILNAFRDKKFLSNEISFCLFVFISAFLIPVSLISYILLALLVYVFSNINAFRESTKKWPILISAAMCALAGIALNKILCTNIESFNEVLKYLSFSDFEQVGSPFVLMLAAVPVFAFGWYFFLIYSKEQSRLGKKFKEKKYQNFPFGFLEICYLLSALGILFFSSSAFLAVNIFLPGLLIVMLLHKNSLVERIVEQINVTVKKHYLISISVLILYCIFSYIVLDKYIKSDVILFYTKF